MEIKPEHSEISREAVLESLPELLEWVHEQIQIAQFPIALAQKYEVALEEAIVNVILYAYPQKPGKIEIKATSFPGQKLEFTIIDEGIHFNPLNVKNVNNDNEHEIKIGGLGITFLKTFVDDVHYERTQSSNILTVVKNF